MVWCLFSLGQNQANIWYFGNHAGVDFNGGSPVALSDGQTYLEQGLAEGSSVICDSSGGLLFYTNGEKIWNRRHLVMANGDSILSSYSSTQSSLILPLPGSDTIFYVFTTDAFVDHNLRYGFRYSVVDICLDNGLGAVVDSQKSILVLDTVCEKLTAVRDSSGENYWVLVHKYFSDAFYAYKLDSNGLTTVPVVSHIGSVHGYNGHTAASIGYMKGSPDGHRLAVVSANGGNVKDLFDFDPTNGLVTNLIDLRLPDDSTMGGYGVTFSPDNSKLYLCANPNHVYQYNLLAVAGNPDSIKASRFQVNSLNSNNMALALGPDGRLYLSETNRPYLSVITQPNLEGAACDFQPNAINLLPGVCSFGLPNLLDSYSYKNGVQTCPVLTSNQVVMESRVKVYPNPSPGWVHVAIPVEKCSSVEVRNPTGQVLYHADCVGRELLIDCGSYPSGIYFVIVRNEDMLVAESIVRQ